MTKETGGSAFPYTQVIDGKLRWTDGMTLRDWFAGQALQGMIASHGIARSAWSTIAPDENANLAYVIADAMLAERNK